MDQRVKELWLDALRSGEYEQGNHALRNTLGDDTGELEYSYCCLGVLCDIYAKEKGVAWSESDYFLGNAAFPPSEVREWAGLTEVQRLGEFGEYDVAYMNDDGSTFTEISDVIEREA